MKESPVCCVYARLKLNPNLCPTRSRKRRFPRKQTSLVVMGLSYDEQKTNIDHNQARYP